MGGGVGPTGLFGGGGAGGADATAGSPGPGGGGAGGAGPGKRDGDGGVANTGGGSVEQVEACGTPDFPSGAGGDGIVIIRYPG